jgi:hypothetical protein
MNEDLKINHDFWRMIFVFLLELETSFKVNTKIHRILYLDFLLFD